MLIGTLLSIAHGSAFPLVTFILGEITDAFVNRAASQAFADPTNSTALFCAVSTVANLSNMSYTDSMDAILSNISNGTVDCSADAFGVTLEDVLHACFSSNGRCLTNDDFLDIVNVLIYGFVAISFGSLIAGFFQISFFQVACERQVKKIRLTYYRSVLRQNIGWFDANPSGELASRLAE